MLSLAGAGLLDAVVQEDWAQRRLHGRLRHPGEGHEDLLLVVEAPARHREVCAHHSEQSGELELWLPWDPRSNFEIEKNNNAKMDIIKTRFQEIDYLLLLDIPVSISVDQ